MLSSLEVTDEVSTLEETVLWVSEEVSSEDASEDTSEEAASLLETVEEVGSSDKSEAVLFDLQPPKETHIIIDKTSSKAKFLTAPYLLLANFFCIKFPLFERL